MKKFLKDNKKIVIRISILITLLVALLTLNIFQNNTQICEWWTRTISRFYQTGIGFMFKYIPFSMMEILVIVLVIYAIYLLVRLIIYLVKKKWISALNNGLLMGILALSMVVGYVATTSLAYYRSEVPIPLYEEKVDKSKFNEVVKYFLDDFNYCSSTLEYDENGEVKMPYNYHELSKRISKEYEKLNDPYFSSFTSNPKPMLSSFLYVQFQITGMYSGLTGEVNFDTFMTHAEYPFTFAHEIAHSKGVMRENDAQLVAAYICLNSDDDFIRYSGYIYTFASLMNLCSYTGNKGDYQLMYSLMKEDIKLNYNYINKYWKEHDLLEKIGTFFNDLYLKIFGSESTDDYKDPPIVIDPGTNEIVSFSRYQKLYFQKYINDGNNLK
jgi:hypothetical protein